MAGLEQANEEPDRAPICGAFDSEFEHRPNRGGELRFISAVMVQLAIKVGATHSAFQVCTASGASP
jgi:hypothetical protein